ncbi:murein L,D-transpeptidase catalytic domain family protein [Methyloligella halotolerans]|uniref:murein L,D-transpeptidase catalytic domain family protein n=1 Tax=Methyloligella halotolerans TaxID=1177755 RepID=UPI001FD91B59|nr:murein L,D-transpeptidase catalytic domain family protein [Methyloligella halotolerans]
MLVRLALATVFLAGLSAAAIGLLPPGGVPAAHAQQLNAPPWLMRHVGTGAGQIAPVVLYRARSLYFQQLQGGKIRNGCYFAMDATRPSGVGKNGRFYIICERNQVFKVMSSGHGNGRNLGRLGNFANGRECAKNFSNAQDSKLTAGGPYLTAELKDSFKGYYKANGKTQPLVRTFIQFEGMGEAANARPREIGGHASVTLHWQCRMKVPGNQYADKEGFVPYGSFVNYTGGRSNGCTSWSWEDAQDIKELVRNNPTTLYIYPESRDIAAVAGGTNGAYWNAACLRSIGKPKFWPKEQLEPVIQRWKASLPKGPPPKPLPICR